MSNRLEGQVAFITGAARGQGRAHALRLARDGVDIIAVDICTDIDAVNYPMGTEDDLKETVRLVEALDRRIVARQADVRDYAALSAAFAEGHAEFGRLDIIVANAGVVRMGPESGDFLADWRDVLDTNLTGVFHTLRAAVPAIQAGGRGGAIVITSSTAGLLGLKNASAGSLAYSSSKRGLVSLMESYARTLAPESIRVNTVHPTAVRSGMTVNDTARELQRQAAAGGSNVISSMQNALPVPMLEADDIADAVAFLVSDEAKYVTGVQFPVDAGFNIA
ncbi:MAG: mycofactocin-coupled SDR family oxidoreductase [Streptosporangiales bacterium]|nr:mycofactocin-coupled SDR family oxidoreductase [Streptosporangiales bacterium]